MQIVRWIGIGVVTIAVLALLAGQVGLLRGSPPGDLGVRAGKLKPPSETPNSVSSQALLWAGHAQREQAHIAPLAVRGDASTTMARLQALLRRSRASALSTAVPTISTCAVKRDS